MRILVAAIGMLGLALLPANAVPKSAASKPAAKTVAKAPEPEKAYIGTYTNENGAAASDNHGEGIYYVELNPKTGKLENLRLAIKTPIPSWITIDQAHDVLYATNNYHGFGDTRDGAVSAFHIDRSTGNLTLINTVAAHGSPVYIALHSSGRYLMAANYGEGTLTVLPVRADGGLGEATDVFHSTGPKSPERADDNPPGNFATSDHAHGRVHMVGMDPSGTWIIANDAGLDKVLLFKLDLASGKLTPSDPLMEKPGAAPRHFVFDPKGRIFYNLLEQDSKLAAYDFDPTKASFKLRQKLSTLPDDYQGSNLASELVITRDGKYLYAANRLRDTITAFAVGKDGMLKKMGEAACQSDYPRSLALDPSDKFLFSLNQRGDQVTVFKLDPKNGLPRFTGQFLGVGSPGTMAFLETPPKH